MGEITEDSLKNPSQLQRIII